MKKISREIEEKHGEKTPLRIAMERHGLAGTIALQAQTQGTAKEIDRLWWYTTSPLTGIPLLLITLGMMFAFLFYGGEWLSTLFSNAWTSYMSPIIDKAIFYVFGSDTAGRILVWGLDAGVLAALAVGIPYVLTFYFMLAFIEDSGYLNSMAFLTDKLMHKLGLHGRAIIPLVAGAGCSVPAIIGTRVLNSTRERIIASTLITLIPCSARTAVILGAVSLFVGWKPALAIYIIRVDTSCRHRTQPYNARKLYRTCYGDVSFQNSFNAKYHQEEYRFKSFVFVAFPIVLLGSLVLGTLYETDYIWKLSSPLSPVVGLPAVAGLTLIFAVLRKKLALQLLVTLAIVMVEVQTTYCSS